MNDDKCKVPSQVGQANTGQGRYDSKRVGDATEVVEKEAYWARNIFSWHGGVDSIERVSKRS